MATTGGKGWWCFTCRKTVKQSSNFCPGCGQSWQTHEAYAPPTAAASWEGQQGWQQTQRGWSPRPRRTKSPRKPGKGSGKGKGKDKQEATAPIAGPTLQQLPVPPQRASVAAPPTATPKPTATTASSSEKASLDKILSALQANEADLNPQLRELLEQHRMDAAKDEAKSLHRVVAHQAAAKRELTKLRTARTAYLQTWQGYLDQVTETIQQQVEDHGATMASYAEKEVQWEASLAEAAAALSKMTRETEEDSQDSDVEIMEGVVEASAAAAAKAQHAADKTTAQHQELLKTLEAVKKAAMDETTQDQASEQPRERTPRRSRSSVPEAVPKQGAEPPPGKAS